MDNLNLCRGGDLELNLKLGGSRSHSGKLEYFFIVWKCVQRISYINPARRIEQIAENPVAIEEWSCPVTVWTLNDPP
jgi:hypothetical protein